MMRNEEETNKKKRQLFKMARKVLPKGEQLHLVRGSSAASLNHVTITLCPWGTYRHFHRMQTLQMLSVLLVSVKE